MKVNLEMQKLIARLKCDPTAENLDILLGKPKFKEFWSYLMKADPGGNDDYR